MTAVNPRSPPFSIRELTSLCGKQAQTEASTNFRYQDVETTSHLHAFTGAPERKIRQYSRTNPSS